MEKKIGFPQYTYMYEDVHLKTGVPSNKAGVKDSIYGANEKPGDNNFKTVIVRHYRLFMEN